MVDHLVEREVDHLPVVVRLHVVDSDEVLRVLQEDQFDLDGFGKVGLVVPVHQDAGLANGPMGAVLVDQVRGVGALEGEDEGQDLRDGGRVLLVDQQGQCQGRDQGDG